MKDANRDRLREAGRRANAVRIGWARIHDEIYGPTERKDVPFPGLFHVTEYDKLGAQAGKLRHDLNAVVNDMAAFAAGMPDLGPYAQRFLATLTEFMEALGGTLRLLESICAGMAKRDEGDFSYTTAHFQTDSLAYNDAVQSHVAMTDSLNTLHAGL